MARISSTWARRWAPSSTAAAGRRSPRRSSVQDQYAPMVNGRGDMGRTPVLTRTDLLVSHELSFADRKRLRFELNIQNLFNQKTATHIFNFLNKGAPAGGQTRAADAIDFSDVEPRGWLRLQRADPGDAGRCRGVRSALRPGRSLQPRTAGAVQREVHLLICRTGFGTRGPEPRLPTSSSASSI